MNDDVSIFPQIDTETYYPLYRCYSIIKSFEKDLLTPIKQYILL